MTENHLITRESDFFSIWADELKKRDSSLLSKSLFPNESKLIIRDLLEASRKLDPAISSDQFASIAAILQILLTLQENQFSSQDIVNYLEALLSTTQRAFIDSSSEDVERFAKTLTYLLDYTRNHLETEQLLKEELFLIESKHNDNVLSMVGSSETIQNLIKEMEPILNNDVSVLIEGETGTGKELMARAIYKNSAFKDGPFITINCAAIPDDLMESELFGYKKGSFTDASLDRPGKFELAHNGILFLDEVYELSPRIQAKLLRILQDKTVIRLGETKERKINVKLICSTNKNLRDLVSSGKFREDLLYRIEVYKISLPPLRDRPSDIVPLASHFLKNRSTEFNKTSKGFSKEATTLMLHYKWPGNIRELDNVVTRAILKCPTPIIGAKDLDIFLSLPEPVENEIALENLSLKSIEKTHISRVMHKNNGNLLRSAKELGITRTTLYSKIKEYGLSQ